MDALGNNDIEKLFSGAPQYYARSEGHFAGAPHPSVAFPFDEELEIRDLADHAQIEDKAWGGVTAWPHLTRDINHDAGAKKQAREKQRSHFHIRCRERPCMLSMEGLEKGTVGYQAALELLASDSLEEEQFGFESLGTKAKAVIEAREKLLSHSGWLHRLPETEILDRLRRNGELYRENDLRKRPSTETYNELFHHFMRPANFVIDKSDEHSLTNQINALVKCLASSNVWVDFSRVEWRLRLGQILWGEQDGDELSDPSSIHDAATGKQRAEEKYWLLMQILLSTELLVRLDAITEGEEYGGGEHFRSTDVAYFERAATQPVKWSLLLARSWLDNIEVIKEQKAAGANAPPSQRRNAWLASLVSKISLHHLQELDMQSSSQKCSYTINGRHGQRQLDGLLHFAKKLQWPGIDSYEERISKNVICTVEESIASGTATKTAEPQEASYFGAWDVTSNPGKKTGRLQTPRRRMAAALHASGWLSKSYIFGLMLPGEALSHFLMATLLENDGEALAKIGSFANLCGGFVYRDKSFWSTSCVVGRVLAAGKGSAECMGWISTEIIPDGIGDSWISIEVRDVAEDMAHLGKKARLWGKKRVERDSSVLGDAEEGSVLSADFMIPHENVYEEPPPSVLVQLDSLKLLPAAASVLPTPLSELTHTPSTETPKVPELPAYPASVKFTVISNGQAEKKLTLILGYDVSFVTAHPCSQSQRVRFLKSPMSPTIQQFDLSGSSALGKNVVSVHRAGHPLHKFFNYVVVHISELVEKKRDKSLTDLLAVPPTNKPNTIVPRINNHVLVIDCVTNIGEMQVSAASSPILERRDSFPAAAKMHFESRRRQFGSDMEVLVRALCAEKGWNAIISRRKRGCLACAVREAGALGWKVVVRVA